MCQNAVCYGNCLCYLRSGIRRSAAEAFAHDTEPNAAVGPADQRESDKRARTSAANLDLKASTKRLPLNVTRGR